MSHYKLLKAGEIKLSSLFIAILLTSTIARAEKRDSVKVSEKTVRLSEVTVTANLPLSDNKVADFYRSNHFATLDNINARLDGMSLIKRGAYALEPQLNGFSGGQLNVTIDGMKMFGACTDKMDPITSYIEPTNLNTITVKQGTSGCENGCTIGGTVDMTMQEPELNSKRPFFVDFGSGFETNAKSKNWLLSTGFSKGKWAYALNGVMRQNENYSDGNGKTIAFSQFRKANLHGVMRFTIDSVSSLKGDFLIDDARNVGYPALPMDVGVAQAYLLALEYRRKGRFPFRIKAYINSIRHIMDDSKRDSLYFLSKNGAVASDSVYMRMDMPGRSTTFGGYAEASRMWNSRNKATVKIDNYTNQSIAEMTMYMRYPNRMPETPMYLQTWPEMVRNVSGIFVQNSTFLSEKLIFTLNGRIDYNFDLLKSEIGKAQFSTFGYQLPSIQHRTVKSVNVIAQYQIAKHLSATATMGFAERLPTIGERLGYYLFNAYDGYDYVGNPFIRPEKSQFIRLQWQWNQPKLKINFSQSYSSIADYILGQNNPNIMPMNFYTKGVRVYTNLPNVKMYSVDFQSIYTPTNQLSIFASSKYSQGEISVGTPLPLIAPLKNVIALQYQLGKFSWQGECENALSQHRINTDFGEKATPGYSVINAKCDFKSSFSEQTLRLSIGVSNLFDRVYYEHLDWGRINRPGRSFDIYIGYRF